MKKFLMTCFITIILYNFKSEKDNIKNEINL